MPIPKDFKGVSFSKDGKHVGFLVPEGKQYRAIIDGQPQPLYDDVTIPVFSPSGRHWFYGGLREKKWQLVRDGKEIAELGGLTSANQWSGLNFIGQDAVFTLWRPLTIFFAEQADNYFVVCFPGSQGKIFKDGAWLPVTFRSFWRQGMGLSPDGKHYCYTVSAPDDKVPTLYLDGVASLRGSGVDNLIYRQPGQPLVYRQWLADRCVLMEGDKPLPGYGPLPRSPRGPVLASANGKHLAALVQQGDQEVVVVDGQAGPAFPTVDWTLGDEFIRRRGSFVWSKDGTAHAYAVYDKQVTGFSTLHEDKEGPVQVVHNHKALRKHAHVRGSSLVLNDDGRHLAYAAQDGGRWLVVADGREGARFAAVGNPVFAGKADRAVYAARTDKGWELQGWPGAGASSQISELKTSPDRESLVYAAKKDGQWRVYRNAQAISEPCDGVVAAAGFQFERSGRVRFVVKRGAELRWITAE